MTDFTQLPLSALLTETAAIAADAQQAFGHLNAQQLNWKPASSSWSVAQCLEHLLNANHPMLRAIDEALAHPHRTRLLERLPVLSGVWGKLMIKVVSPGFKQKLKAPSDARPATGAIDTQVVTRFVSQQHELRERLQRLEHTGMSRVAMTSPFVRWVTYSLLDACRLIVAHERRHLAQAQRVVNSPGFPW